MRWDQGRFHVERKCDHTGGQRFFECAGGWHTVDTRSDGRDALREAADVQRDTGVPHRVLDNATGEALS